MAHRAGVMSLIGISYPLFLLFAVSVYWFAVPSRWRMVFMAVLSLGFISAHGAVLAVHLGVMVVAVFLCAQAMRKMAAGHGRVMLLVATLTALVVHLAFFKSGTLAAVPGGPLALVPLGLSYVTFRLIHYAVEAYRQRAPEAGFFGFLSYALFFPAFLAGPVERFERFHPQAATTKPDIRDINYGLVRIASGIVKKAFIADQLASWTAPVLGAPAEHSPAWVLLGVYILAVQIYMDFSGYTDIAVGSARLFGFRIVENFDRPFLQPNIARFWRSWHISVSTFIRDYFFLPLFGYRASEFKLYLGLIASMLVFHLWHGFSLSFLLLGLYHGFGLAGWQFFQQLQGRHAGLKRVMDSRPATFVSVCATFTFVSLGMVLLVSDAERAFALYRQIALICGPG